jgi:ribosomal protein S18 acetylase RimI-like enzyme
MPSNEKLNIFQKIMTFVRKAKLEDAELIATYLLLAMEEIVYKFIGVEDLEKASAFLLHFVKKEDNQYSYQNCWVVEDELKVVAAINVYDGANLMTLRKPIVEYLSAVFKMDFNYGNETQAGEYYIDSFGVNPNQQGKGFGTKLLKFVIQAYFQEHNRPLGLLVDKDNPIAKSLYFKLGFKIVGVKVLFGKVMEHLQIKAKLFNSKNLALSQ